MGGGVGAQPAGHLLLDHRLRAARPARAWAGHDLNYLAVGGYLDCTGPGPDGGPPIPGATIADSAGGGMQAVMAILAALVRRATTGTGAYLDVSVADGVLAIMALQVDEYLATGDVPGPRHGLLTGRYACYDCYPTRDGKWVTAAAIEPRFWANLCAALGLERWAAHQTDDAVQDDIRRDLRAAFSPRTATSGPPSCRRPTRVSRPCSRSPRSSTTRSSRRGARSSRRNTARHGTFRQVGPLFAGMTAAPLEPYSVRDATETDTEELLRASGMSAEECAELRETG